MRRNTLRALWVAAALFGWVIGVCSDGEGYSNCNPASIMDGGPHRLLNDLAVKRFVGTLDMTDPRKAYAEAAGYDLLGPSFVERGEWMEAPPEQEQPFTWKEWVVEGGFTADEPELFNSFRHFYDPLSRSPDPSLTDMELRMITSVFSPRQGVPYLTDHLKQIELHLGHWGLVPNPAIWYANVKVNAKSWAVTGDASAGGTENAYSWMKGRGYFEQAFSGQQDGKPLSKAQRDRLYAKAWRSAGETMHLLADMTCIPHVRNDSHPGVSLRRMLREKTAGIKPEDQGRPEYSACLGLLKHDPYEMYCQDDMITRCVPDPVKLDILPATMIQKAKDPERLFDLLALFTNRHFLSADTIPFIPDSAQYRVLLQPNGCLAYKDPWIFSLGERVASERSPAHKYRTYSTREIEYILRLGPLEVDRLVVSPSSKNGFSTAMIWGKTVRLCHRTWLSFAGWAEPADSHLVTYPCVEDQASILLPLAVVGNAKLLDLFVPKLEVIIDEINYNTKVLRGTVRHTPYGAFPEPLLYNDNRPSCAISIDGQKPQPLDPKKVSVNEGAIKARLNDLDLKPGQKVVLEMEVAGFRIPSKPYGEDAWVLIDRKVIVRPGVPEGYLFKADVQGTTARLTGSMLSESEPYESFTCEYTWSDLPERLRPTISFGHKAYKDEMVPGEKFSVPLGVKLVERVAGQRDSSAQFYLKAEVVCHEADADLERNPTGMTVGQSTEVGIAPNYHPDRLSDAKTGTFQAGCAPPPETVPHFTLTLTLSHNYSGQVLIVYRYAYDPTGSSVTPYRGHSP